MKGAIEPGVERTGRWRGIGAATLLAAALGLVGRQPALLLVGAAGVALLAYARVVAPPPLALSIRRTAERYDAGGADAEVEHSDDAAAEGADAAGVDGGEAIDPGDRIAVTVEVENAGDRTIPDLRLVDGVPAALSVVEGSPRVGTTLRSGETASCSYVVEARAGRHEFEPVAAIARDVAGVVERRDRIAVDEEALEADPSEELRSPPPARSRAARFVGTSPADATGEGLAFESVRAYRHGDPPGRIDWRRLARTGELATVTYRKDRGRSVVLVVDARPAAALAPSTVAPMAIERSLTAASGLLDRLVEDGHRVGVARLGPDRRWLAPGSGTEHRQRAGELLAERPPGVATESADESATDSAWLREQLPPRAEVLLCSPCTDEAIVDLARHVDATGTPVTVLSPDPTDGGSAGRRLARIERRHRLRSLHAAGVPVLDWPVDEPLELAVRRASVRTEREVTQ